jgi:hypothetical protein
VTGPGLLGRIDVETGTEAEIVFAVGMPSSAATRCAPLFTMKFSSVQVRPERKVTTGTLPSAACGGTNTENRMSQ